MYRVLSLNCCRASRFAEGAREPICLHNIKLCDGSGGYSTESKITLCLGQMPKFPWRMREAQELALSPFFATPAILLAQTGVPRSQGVHHHAIAEKHFAMFEQLQNLYVIAIVASELAKTGDDGPV